MMGRSPLSRVVCSVVSFVVVVVLLLVSIFLLAFSFLRLHALSTGPSTTSLLLQDFYIPGSTYPVLLPSADGDDGFNGFDPSSLSGIEISTQPFSSGGNSPVADIDVKLFTGSCDFNYTDIKLPKIPRVLKPFSDIRLPFNYNYGNLPFYAAGNNSTLTYALSSSNAPADQPAQTDKCLLELFLFDDYTKYRAYILSDAEGYLNRSGCLPVGSKNDTKASETVFQLTNPNSYYVAIASKTNIETSANISAHANEFSSKQLKTVSCTLNDAISKCDITFGNTHSKLPLMSSTGPVVQPVCVWAIARNGVNVNVTADSVIHENEIIFYASTSTGSAVIGVTMLCFLGVLMIQCRRRGVSSHYQQSEEEKKSLLHTEHDVTVASKSKSSIQF